MTRLKYLPIRMSLCTNEKAGECSVHLPQVPYENVGPQGPPHGQQLGVGEALLDVRCHHPHVVCKRSRVELHNEE
jgi:hypothetical protein